MPSERPFRLRRRRDEPGAATQVAAQQPAEVADEPEVVVEVMEAATQRLREQAWKINATTRAVLIPEEATRAAASDQPSPF